MLLQRKIGMHRLVELLDGLLIGDGCLRHKSQNANYTHTCKHKEYVEWIKAELEQYGISFTPNIYEKPNGYNTGVGYQIHSHVHEMLTQQYYRWYPEGKKRPPIDINLTPTVIKHWYVGDGGFDSDKGYLRQIKIAAHSFEFAERQILVDKLNTLGFKTSNRKSGNICISKSSISNFLDYIENCPVNCYQYKWNTSLYQNKQPKYKLS